MKEDMKDRIEKLLVKRGMTKQDLAAAIGLTSASVYSWFLSTKNNKDIRVKNLEKIAKCLDVSVTFLKTGKEDESKVARSIAPIYYPIVNVKDEKVSFECFQQEAVLIEVQKKHNIDRNHILCLKFYDQSMFPTFQDIDYIYIDDRELSDIKEGAYYLLATLDEICIRYVYKDVILNQYHIKSASGDEAILKSDDFHNLFIGIYKILGLQRVF